MTAAVHSTQTARALLTAMSSPRTRLEALASAKYEAFMRAERSRQSARGGLIHFVRYFWETLEPNREFIDGWPLWAMCRHLEAVSRGEITRLLINISPGSMKSLLVNVFWPAWEWSAFKRPDLRYVSFSYASYLTERDNERFLNLLKSQKFADMWGDAIVLTAEGKVKVSNSARGWKFASSVGGVGTGERGDRLLLDDPHNIKDGESETIRDNTVRWFKEAMSNRLNDMVKSAIIVIMQRVSEDDVAGTIIADGLPYTHLMIPMEYEPDRACSTSIGWRDPRTAGGSCFWPERFPPAAVAHCRQQGDFVWASQYQQRPEICGGGLFKREYWQLYESSDGRWPSIDYVVASLDPAFTTKQANDPSGFTIWGSFKTRTGDRGLILMYGARLRLELHGPEVERWPSETNDDYRARCRDKWGLVERVADECRRFKADVLLIESKASGLSVSQEMLRLFPRSRWGVELVNPGNLDKLARAIRVQPVFSNGQVWAPDRKWADMVIDEMAVFPKGKFDDLTDSVTQAIHWLKEHGFATRSREITEAALIASEGYHQDVPLYQV